MTRPLLQRGAALLPAQLVGARADAAGPGQGAAAWLWRFCFGGARRKCLRSPTVDSKRMSFGSGFSWRGVPAIWPAVLWGEASNLSARHSIRHRCKMLDCHHGHGQEQLLPKCFGDVSGMKSAHSLVELAHEETAPWDSD